MERRQGRVRRGPRCHFDSHLTSPAPSRSGVWYRPRNVTLTSSLTNQRSLTLSSIGAAAVTVPSLDHRDVTDDVTK